MVSPDLPRSTVTNQNCIPSTRFAFDSFIRTCDGLSMLGASFQIVNLIYHPFYLTDLACNLSSFKTHAKSLPFIEIVT